ncbi:MAG: hypothetical protein KGO02_18870 [Alphaproteobacteria bacterium]|nr:hypothetical protein [Alphaproteobacteria bacterium]
MNPLPFSELADKIARRAASVYKEHYKPDWAYDAKDRTGEAESYTLFSVALVAFASEYCRTLGYSGDKGDALTMLASGVGYAVDAMGGSEEIFELCYNAAKKAAKEPAFQSVIEFVNDELDRMEMPHNP